MPGRAFIPAGKWNGRPSLRKGLHGRRTEGEQRSAMEKIRLLIAEDNSELSDILTNFFEMSGEIDLCGTARDGEETLTKIEEQTPDVVLLDLVMPRLDGISVLERLREKPPAKMPNIIIASAIGLENVTRRALELGACYYMIKPYNLGDLLRRVRMFAFPVSSASQTAPTARITAEDFQNRLKRALLSLGVPPNVLGFPYIVESAKILADTPGPCSITKLVYPAVAERNGTTADCVESAVRKTIARIYERDSEALRALMGQTMGDKRPSNAHFLTLLAEKVRDGVLGD